MFHWKVFSHLLILFSEPGISKELPRSKKKDLSPGIKEVILKTDTGALSPEELLQFLDQVRGRQKKAKANIAAHFTEDIPALISQLQNVIKAYYVKGQRGREEEVDVKFIQSLKDFYIKNEPLRLII